jgi:hypothetical protein
VPAAVSSSSTAEEDITATVAAGATARRTPLPEVVAVDVRGGTDEERGPLPLDRVDLWFGFMLTNKALVKIQIDVKLTRNAAG